MRVRSHSPVVKDDLTLNEAPVLSSAFRGKGNLSVQFSGKILAQYLRACEFNPQQYSTQTKTADEIMSLLSHKYSKQQSV